MRVHRSVLLVLLLGGCGGAAATGPTLVTPPPLVAPAPEPAPAAAAGGACQMLDFAVINRTLGTNFDVAAATDQGQSRSCVVQSTDASRPDLLLTVSPTGADPAVFRSEVVPEGARGVTGLGRAAYRTTAKAGRGGGPAAEVGWLSRDGRLVTLRYTLPKGARRSVAQGMTGRLATLAKAIDRATAATTPTPTASTR